MKTGSGDQADHTPQALVLAELYLRFSVIPLAVVSLWLMVTDRQVPHGYSKLDYTAISGLKYLVSVDAISASYTLVALVLSRLRSFTADWVFYVCDQVVAYLMLTSGSAVAEVLFLAYRGSRETSWSEACSYYGQFCSRAKMSLLLHFPAFLSISALAAISAFRFFSKFEAPCVTTTSNSSSRENGGQVE